MKNLLLKLLALFLVLALLVPVVAMATEEGQDPAPDTEITEPSDPDPSDPDPSDPDPSDPDPSDPDPSDPDPSDPDPSDPDPSDPDPSDPDPSDPDPEDPEEPKDPETLLAEKIKEIVAMIPKKSSDWEKALFLHDYLAENVEYASTENDQTAFGALVEGKAVCAGYADAYMHLLTEVGIDCKVITGTGINSKGDKEPHAWNMVTLDGKCVFTDVTWDSQVINGERRALHGYFNLSLEKITADHKPDDASKDLLPQSCKHSDLDYFTKKQEEGSGIGVFFDLTNADFAAKYFKLSDSSDTTVTYSCYFRFDGEDLELWLENVKMPLIEKLNLIGEISIAYYTLGDTCLLSFTGEPKPVPLEGISLPEPELVMTKLESTHQLVIVFAPANATNQKLHFVSDNPEIVSVDENGLLTALAVGTATITITSDEGGFTCTCTVTVDTNHYHDERPEEIKAKRPTCTENGNVLYYRCSGCRKYFADFACTERIHDLSTVLIPATGHTDDDLDCICDVCGGNSGEEIPEPTYPTGPDEDPSEPGTQPSDPSQPQTQPSGTVNRPSADQTLPVITLHANNSGPGSSGYLSLIIALSAMIVSLVAGGAVIAFVLIKKKMSE